MKLTALVEHCRAEGVTIIGNDTDGVFATVTYSDEAWVGVTGGERSQSITQSADRDDFVRWMLSFYGITWETKQMGA